MYAVRSLYHWKSALPAASNALITFREAPGLEGFMGYFEVALNHLCTSACPSQKEKPQAPLWKEAGTSPQLLLLTPTMKKASFTEAGCSSRVSHVIAGLGTSAVFRNCR